MAHDSGRWWRACAVNSDEEPFPNVGIENIQKNIPSSDCRSGRRGVEETDEREPQESAVAFVLDCVTNVVGMSQELTSRASRAVRSTGPRTRGGEKISHTSDLSLRSYIAPRPSSVTAIAPDTCARYRRAQPPVAASRPDGPRAGPVAQENETDRENVPVRGHFRVRPHGRVPRRVRHAFGGVPDAVQDKGWPRDVTGAHGPRHPLRRRLRALQDAPAGGDRGRLESGCVPSRVPRPHRVRDVHADLPPDRRRPRHDRQGIRGD
mmetsp:Transcript_9037/g.39773  ORF Transcript_9037/g.39773 Transcript_9037/m.39773 type:complete len:264 (+) Transcript_9037:1735-2526(+)